jgi:3-(3-hydroxy-phenyl)propionate hydroxylase
VVLSLARERAFARPLVNTGRLSTPAHFPASPLNVGRGGGVPVQNVALLLAGEDGAHTRCELVELLARHDDVLLAFHDAAAAPSPEQRRQLERDLPLRFVALDAQLDRDQALRRQLGIQPGELALLRPDLYLAGVLEEAAAVDAEAIRAAVDAVLGVRR